MTFQDRLTYYREKAGLRQSELARMIEVSPARLSNWELGKRTPDMKMVMKISEALGVTSDRLLGMEKSSPEPIDSEELHEAKELSMELTELFARFGFIEKREDFTEADFRFMRGVVALISNYFDKES